MIDFQILEKMGTNDDAIRRLFTADLTTDLGAKRKAWEDRIENRVHEGTMYGLRNYQFFAAADLAWDSNIITKELVPLQLFAQGKITFKALETQLRDVSTETAKKFCQYGPKGELTGIDIPAFHKVVVNLVRSFITRRVAALAGRYTKLQPLYRYEPLSTSFVAKLRGDALSQRIEMIVNGYGYRHDMTQSIRDMLLYGYSLEFAATAWDQDKQLRKKKGAPGADTSTDKGFDSESYVTREGILYTRPHPSRTFWDNAYPLASINTDTGCSFLGYWSVVRYGDVAKNPIYFNRDKISFDQAFLSQLTSYGQYWELYFANAPVNFPGSQGTMDVPGRNDREKNIGSYTADNKDQSVIFSEIRERVIPKEVGLGDYPYPVWVRLVVAGGRTVVYGEILPSIPAVYTGYNCDDSRQLNNAWAHDIMPWQDLLSNGLSNLLLSQRAALIKLIMLDVDQVNNPDVLNAIRSIVAGESIFNKPHLIEYKGAQYDQMGIKPRDAVQVAETQPVNDITMYYRSLMQLLGLAERMLGMSANESAQSEQREISATESANIASTTNTTIAFMGIGVDEAVDAKKRQLYESFVALGETRVQVPAVNRYTMKTIEAAGFKVLDEDQDGTSESMYPSKTATLLGSKENLVYDYNFSSRDGSERASNPKAAEVLVNLLSQLVQFPGFAEMVGKERLFMFLNEIVLLSGAGVDLRFDLRDGESTATPTGEPGPAPGLDPEAKKAIEEAIHQLMDAISADRQQIAQIGAVVQQLTGRPLPPPPAAPGQPPAAPAPAPGQPPVAQQAPAPMGGP